MKKLCIVILNWKGAQDTIDCLSSFHAQSMPEGLHLVVVDNASPDDSVERILSWTEGSGMPTDILDHNAQGRSAD